MPHFFMIIYTLSVTAGILVYVLAWLNRKDFKYIRGIWPFFLHFTSLSIFVFGQIIRAYVVANINQYGDYMPIVILITRAGFIMLLFALPYLVLSYLPSRYKKPIVWIAGITTAGIYILRYTPYPLFLDDIKAAQLSKFSYDLNGILLLTSTYCCVIYIFRHLKNLEGLTYRISRCYGGLKIIFFPAYILDLNFAATYLYNSTFLFRNEDYVNSPVFLPIMYLIWSGMALRYGLQFLKRKKAASSAEKRQRFFKTFVLTRREQEVTSLMIDGKSNKEIADTLFISLPTVKTYASRIFKKLSCRQRTAVIAKFQHF